MTLFNNRVIVNLNKLDPSYIRGFQDIYTAHKIPHELAEKATIAAVNDIAGMSGRKIIKKYSAISLFYASIVMDSLKQIGIPQEEDSVQAAATLLDITHNLQGNFEIQESLIGMMSTYGMQIPLSFSELPKTMDILMELYRSHGSSDYKHFDYWGNYQFRDGVLDVSCTVLKMFGVSAETADKKYFGGVIFNEKLVLPGTTTMEFLPVLYSMNKDIADAGLLPHHIHYFDVEKSKSNTWKGALYDARAVALKKPQRKMDVEHINGMTLIHM